MTAKNWSIGDLAMGNMKRDIGLNYVLQAPIVADIICEVQK